MLVRVLLHLSPLHVFVGEGHVEPQVQVEVETVDMESKGPYLVMLKKKPTVSQQSLSQHVRKGTSVPLLTHPVHIRTRPVLTCDVAPAVDMLPVSMCIFCLSPH